MSARMNTMSSLVRVRPRYRHSTGICDRVWQNRNRNARPGGDFFLYAHTTPDWRRPGVRITGGQQHLRLMRAQRLHRFESRRPPAEATFRQTFGRQPETLTVVGQDTDGLRAPAAEDKQAAGKRIGIQLLAAKLRQRIDAFSAVDGFDRHLNPRLR